MLNESPARGSGRGDADDLAKPRPNAGDEIELKLLAPPGAFEQIRKSKIITRHARNGGVTRNLEAIYYDTSDRSLFLHGLSLRVRRSGNSHVQTLKREKPNGQAFVRQEWESPVETTKPDLTLLPVAEIGVPLKGLSSDALTPIFMTKVRRRIQHLDLPGAVIEVAFDEGCIEAGERYEPLTELELEMKSGDPRVLYDLGMELLEAAPLRIGTQSKSDRGYDLAFKLNPKARKATTPPVNATHTVDDIIGILLGHCQRQLLANQAVAEVGLDPEGVHQMRVALRRLRTACVLLHAELGAPALQAFNADAKWLGKLLGAARDWDVFVTETLTGPSAALASDGGFAALRLAAEPHRRAAYAAVRGAFASRRYNQFQLSMRRWIESRGWRNELADRSLATLMEPAPDFAARILTRLHRKALKKGARFQHLSPASRHQLRISLKKLRYAADFFHGLHKENAEAKFFHARLADLQDALGQDNDATATLPCLRTLDADAPEPETLRTIGVVMGWQARGGLAAGKKLHRLWKRFRESAKFWPHP